uniref:Si:ch73-389k6.1 n=1 Tax=Iconisemion striatum TaxID=60296 RepID=A0A1A7WM63_9TELE
MGRRCSVVGCSSSVGLHLLPPDLEIRRQWLRAIGVEENCELSHDALVCKRHFTRDSYANIMEFELGYAQRLRLKSEAVPTVALSRINRSPPTLLPRPSGSQLKIAPRQPRTMDVSCQTDVPYLVSQGTQVPKKRLRPILRNKGIQSAATVRSVAVGPSRRLIPVPFPSTPLRSFNAAKRPRLEFEEEQTEDISTRSTNPDSSSAHSVTTSTDSSWLSPTAATSSYEDAKFIVFERCLLSLFETCPVCTRDCNVQPRRRGTLLTVDQRCPHCRFFRRWNSQPIIGSTPVGDLQLSAAIHFCGDSFEQMSKVFDAMHLKTHTDDVFRRHVSSYLEPAIIHTWNERQCMALQSLTEEDQVVFGGDMCAESPGEH